MARAVGERTRSNDKRERILQASVKVFARKGFYLSRVAEIAKTAGVADGTIYLYFKNKDHLLISIFEDRIDAMCDAVEARLAGVDDPAEKLRRIIDLQLGLVAEHRDLAEVLTINLRQSTRFLKQFAAPKFNRYLDTIAAVVQEGQDKGLFHTEISPRVFACSLFGALDGLTLTWVIGKGDPVRLEKAASAAATILIDGIRARGEGARQQTGGERSPRPQGGAA